MARVFVTGPTTGLTVDLHETPEQGRRFFEREKRTWLHLPLPTLLPCSSYLLPSLIFLGSPSVF